MQAGMRTRRRKTQQITAVQMIGEVIHPYFEFLAGCEQFVLTAGHGCYRTRNILFHGLRRAVGEIEQVKGRVLFVFVRTAAGVENVRERRRKRESIHYGVALSDGG